MTAIAGGGAGGAGWQRLLVGVVGLTVLVGLPLLVGWVGLRYFLDLRQQTCEQQHSARLGRILEIALPKGEPTVFLNRALRGLVRRAQGAADPLGVMLQQVRVLEGRHPQLFSFTLFDAADQPVHVSDPRSSRRVARELLRWVREARSTGVGLAHWNREMVCPYLGITDLFYSIRVKGVLAGWANTSDNAHKTWFFAHVGKRFSLFVHVHRRGFSPVIGLRPLVIRSRSRALRVHLVDLRGMEAIGECDPALATRVTLAALRLEREPHRMLHYEGRLWRQLNLDDRWRLMVSLPDAEIHAPNRLLSVAGLVMAGLFGLGGFAVAVWVRRDPPPFMSIRVKLVSLFAIAVGTPLFVLALILVAYLGEREKILVQNAHLDSLTTLRGFDGDLAGIGRVVNGTMRRLFARFPVRQPARVQQFKDWFAEHQLRWRISSMRMISSLSVEIPLQIGESRNPRAGKLVTSVLERLVQRVTGVYDARTARKQAEFEMFLGMFSDNAAIDFIDRIAERRGSIFSIELGPLEGWLYFDWLPVTATAPQYIYTVMWDRDDLYWVYLQRMLPFPPLSDGTELLAVAREPKTYPYLRARPDSKTDRWRFRFMHRAIPDRPVGRWFRKPLMLMQYRPGILQRHVTYRGQPYLLSGFPGDQLQGISLFALRPLAPIRREISRLALEMVVFGCLSAGFALGCGLLLARQLLTPIRDLARGVDAVHRQDLRWRVPPGDADELGALSSMFNHMLDNLQEVSMARVVQERLFPAAVLGVGEYQAFGRSKPASALGGDYFDYVAVGSRLLLVLGDVTGHGVPAALMMAMAKSTLIRCVATGEPLTEVVAAFNHVFFVAGGKRTLMTTVFVEVDTDTHRVQIWNCGHPFPLRQTPEGGLTFVEAAGTILGLRPRPAGRPVELALAPGDRLILYTDGVVESLAVREGSAFDRFARYVASRPLLPPDAGCDDLLAEYPFFARRDPQPLPQPDDFTVVILQRLPRVAVPVA